MMRVEAQNYFDLMVAPTCEEYFREPWSLRRAAVALIAMCHLADYYAMEGYTGLMVRRDMDVVLKQRSKPLLQTHPQLRAIKDAADAVKHGRLSTMSSRGEPVPRNPSAADELLVTAGIFQAPFGHGRFAGGMDVQFEDADGRMVSVRALLTEGLALWVTKLRPPSE